MTKQKKSQKDKKVEKPEIENKKKGKTVDENSKTSKEIKKKV